MTLFGRRERRTVGSPENPRYPLTASNLLEWFGAGAAPNDSGVSVTPTNSLSMSAVFRCVALISSVGGELPLRVYRRGSFERVESRLLAEPHPDMTPHELWQLLLVHRALWGNAYAQKLRNRAGEVMELWPVRPDRVTPGKVAPSPSNRSGKVFDVVDDAGRHHALTNREIFHVPHLGYDGVAGLSPVSLARQAIGMSMAAESYSAKLFGSGNLLSGFISTEARLDETQAKRIQASWRERMLGRHNQHDVAVLDSGADFKQLTMPNSDAQFLESRVFQIPEVGRWFGVPPFLLYETSKSTSWGTGLEQQAIGFTMFDLGPQWLTPTEQRITKELLPAEQEARYQRQKLLRGDSKARAEYYRTMREWAGFSADEVRAEEDMPPVPGGGMRLQPMNFQELGTEPAPAPGRAPTDPASDDDESDPDDEGGPDAPDADG